MPPAGVGQPIVVVVVALVVDRPTAGHPGQAPAVEGQPAAEPLAGSTHQKLGIQILGPASWAVAGTGVVACTEAGAGTVAGTVVAVACTMVQVIHVKQVERWAGIPDMQLSASLTENRTK